MDILSEHSYAKPPPECGVDSHFDLLQDFDLGFVKVENDVWLDSLDSLGDTVDMSELLKLAPCDVDPAADFFSIGDDCDLSVSSTSKGSPLSDAGYDSMTGVQSPESSSSGSDCDSSPSGMECSSQQAWVSPKVDLDALFGDLQDAVKATAEMYSNPVKYDSTRLQTSSPSDTISLGQTSIPAVNTSKVTMTRESEIAPPAEKRKKLAQNHSDRISGPTAFLGNSVCWGAGLMLTEEEKETLLADGCPVPTSLPLTSEEEKALKLARRKIKNKISAQESRRKKKEFIETMQERADASARENRKLQQRVENLESENRTLLEELQALKQDIARKQLSRPPVSAHATLLVLAVCFAFAFPALWGSSMSGLWLPGTSQTGVPSAGGKVPGFDYTVTNFRSRTLMQLKDHNDVYDNDHYEDINASGGGAPPDDSVGLSVDFLTASSPRAFMSLEEDSGQSFPEAVAIVGQENSSVPVPA